MSALELFQYGNADVRVVLIDGEPWFVLADLCRVLGISDVSVVRRRLDDALCLTHPIEDSMGRTQNATIVSEPGMYEVIIRSDSPTSKPVRRWITHEVLPAIRKTGAYGQAVPTGTNLLALAVIEAQQMLEAQTHQIESLTPRAEAWDELASADGDYEVADAAKILARAGVETGRQRLFGQLESIGWIYRNTQNKWKARQSAVDSGYLAEKPQSHHHPRTGEIVLDAPQVRVTIRGIERLRVRLGSLDTGERAA